MKKQDRALKAKGYTQTSLKNGVVTESQTLANSHKIEIKTTTVCTSHQMKDGSTKNRTWSRSVVLPESTMR